ncbi:hypothetical protein DBADOPDK_06208 [Pseudomonas sp. MM223]|nr:hypothetical protein DBADOPDK_06208 [Pseudomonas sp. MM223]
MSDDNYVLERIKESSQKISYEQMLKSAMHDVLMGFRKGDAATLVKWPDASRGVPNSILRSALFSAVGRGQRTIHLATNIETLQGVTMVYSGPQLDQADLDVWEQCLHLSRTTSLGLSLEISSHPFLKAIGRETGKSQRDWLKDSFKRLLGGMLEVQDGRINYAGHLISEYLHDENTGRYCVVMNPNIVKLYGDGMWTMVELNERLALKGHPLAQWLHGFYSTHAKAYPLKVATIHKLCGSRSKNVTDFRKDVRKAFALMHAAIGWKGEINDKGLVTMDRPPSRAQQRHLNAKVPD